MSGFDHSCQRAEDAEAVIRNLALFSHLSGENRAQMGWPVAVSVFAFRITGHPVQAELLALEEARREHRRAAVLEIPHQRKPHPLDELNARRTRSDNRSGR
jgi:hypothetical protein